MNHLNTLQNVPDQAWDGAASIDIDAKNFVTISFSAKTTAAIAADAVFKLQGAPASAANPCLPGVYVDVTEISRCGGGVVGGNAYATIPLGTAIGTRCAFTWPCKSYPFYKIVPVSGTTASVKVFSLLSGPK